MIRFLTYLLAGPPIGNLIFFPATRIYMCLHAGQSACDFADFASPKGVLLIAALSYIPGILPAILTYMFVTAAEQALPRRSLLVVGACGCIGTALAWLVYQRLDFTAFARADVPTYFLFIAGAIAAILTELLYRWKSRLGVNAQTSKVGKSSS